MLNMISSYEMTQKPLPRFGLGACLPVPMAAATPASKGAVAFRRPPAPVAGMGLHFALTVSGQAVHGTAKSDAASDQRPASAMSLRR